MLAAQVAVARAIAIVAHKDQERLGHPSEPYIEHLRRVADACSGPAVCVAWLHDVLEDTSVQPRDLAAAGVAAPVVDAVQMLTHPHNITTVDYLEYIANLKRYNDATGGWARAVKLADLADNLASVPRLRAAGLDRLALRLDDRYRAAQSILRSA